MRKSTRAATDSAAQKRIVEAAGSLAARFDLLVPDDLINPKGDLLVKAMKQREVIADLLEAVDEKVDEKDAEIKKLKRSLATAKRKAKVEPEADNGSSE